MDTLNSVYLLNNHQTNPLSEIHHHDKFLIATIHFHITKTTHPITLQNVKAHNHIKGYIEVDTLASQGALKPIIQHAPFHLIGYPTPYWFGSHHTSAQHDGSNKILNKELNLSTKTPKIHKNQYIPLFTNDSPTMTHILHSQMFFNPPILRYTQLS